ncbi:uncharacterized protein LOC119588384 [Penaeus monodon]|uniref:uncharacterized protein LOC119588384 n=1 Tax=Penaeus monodon TaxID=6687 RepID=UPI0018A6F830|nr:uncharacterized protein LOC119588384 [Penaeus monodon]
MTHQMQQMLVFSLLGLALLGVFPLVEACDIPCPNRFGKQRCCDGVSPNDFPTCPPMPRVEVNCSDKTLFEKEVRVQTCRSDRDCKSSEKCCRDICETGHICMPGIINQNFLFR